LDDAAHNGEPLQEEYGRRLRRAARLEFHKFWSAYRWCMTAVGLVSAVIPGGLRLLYKVGTVYDVLAALGLSLLVFLASAGGCYIIAMRKGAEALDAAQGNSLIQAQQDARELRQEINNLRHAPAISALEQTRRDRVENAFRKRSPEHSPLDLAVLTHLLLHGKANQAQVVSGVVGAGTALPKDIRADLAVRAAIHRCFTDHFLDRTAGATPTGDPDRFDLFEVKPDLRDALAFHLFEKTKSTNPCK
jgi:hypothetical protein